VQLSTLAVVAVVLVTFATVAVGAFGLRLSRTTSDFYVAGRAVSPGWNASAISGEYLSAASFLGVAGLVLTAGTDMLWFPVGYTAGYLVLLVLVAAPLRRSGAYTLPDFAEDRLESRHVRLATSLLVVAIGWLYLLPQLQGAGLALGAATGAPRWVGGVVVAVVVLLNVVAGGMRSITFVQAFQYWLKLTAIAVPVFFLLMVWHGDGSPSPAAMDDGSWVTPLSGEGGREHPLYSTYSVVLALCFGTMGLPHVLVRFYTNPDGRGARRTTLTVIALLGAFYLFPPVYGALGRVYASDLLTSGHADTVVLLLPSRLVPGVGGLLLSALTTAGAFAAFLSTSSGLAMSVAGVLHQDLRRRRTGTVELDTMRGFRPAVVLAVGVPLALSLVSGSLGLADTVGLAFAVAASTFCPLLVLGIWWRRLTRAGALAGLVVGGATASAAVLVTMTGVAGGGWAGTLLAQPAAWTVPLAFAVMVLVSLATPGSQPAGVNRTMVRLHTPEDVAVERR
jgi:cation/acetate symporter